MQRFERLRYEFVNAIELILLVGAALCFGAAALRRTMRVELVATGLLLWLLATELVSAVT